MRSSRITACPMRCSISYSTIHPRRFVIKTKSWKHTSKEECRRRSRAILSTWSRYVPYRLLQRQHHLQKRPYRALKEYPTSSRNLPMSENSDCSKSLSLSSPSSVRLSRWTLPTTSWRTSCPPPPPQRKRSNWSKSSLRKNSESWMPFFTRFALPRFSASTFSISTNGSVRRPVKKEAGLTHWFLLMKKMDSIK